MLAVFFYYLHLKIVHQKTKKQNYSRDIYSQDYEFYRIIKKVHAIMVSFEQVNWHSNNQWQRLMVRSIQSCFGMSKMFFLYSMYTVTNSLQISGACSALFTRQNYLVSMSILSTGLPSSLMPSLSIFFPHPYSLRHSLKKITQAKTVLQ